MIRTFSNIIPIKYLKKSVPEEDIPNVLAFCHEDACEGHFSSKKTNAKVFHCGFYRPTIFKDAHNHCKACHHCQMLGSISKRDMVPLSELRGIDLWNHSSYPLAISTFLLG